MSNTITVSTQGINESLTDSNGDFDTVERGEMTPDEFVDFIRKASQLKIPESIGDSEEYCPPHIITNNSTGIVSFLMDGGKIECLEVEDYVTPFEACMLANGEKNPEVMKLEKSGGTKLKSTDNSQANSQLTENIVIKRGGKFKRFLGYVLSLIFISGGIIIGVAGIRFGLKNGKNEDLYIGLAALVIGVIIGFIIFRAVKKSAGKSGSNYDANEGIVYAQTLNAMHDDNYNDSTDYGDFDGGD
ncbi:MAG: hypothetical protein HOI47_04505 [Candidatus Scalindua sp.]|jgi:hypothetical protein|nr:hypothetical protein [Candidatus Scalindua sp.]MBT5305613.1 hypothetical protein [Candidatus Scalindua sp.]MBT6225902.1 hypothetical protein [Candidatus Scalindua sp.]MBT7211706.1 hypothetical protein [Candidatus Scalindua sp.]MBT7591560.1 hypothetical protein [Candidatus Scalindua sp.]